jgi:membrane associated rhomboid family serine protease
MARIGSSTLAFPPFRGFIKRLVLANLAVYFVILVLGAVNRPAGALVSLLLSLTPNAVAHGYIWQLITYSFLHFGVLEVLFNLLSLWFIGSYLEEVKGSRWVAEIYFLAVIGGGLIATALSFAHLPSDRHCQPLRRGKHSPDRGVPERRISGLSIREARSRART